jgi:hypothetical protein
VQRIRSSQSPNKTDSFRGRRPALSICSNRFKGRLCDTEEEMTGEIRDSDDDQYVPKGEQGDE